MKCEICKRQTINTIDDEGAKRYICEICLDDIPVEPAPGQEQVELKCSFMIGLLDNGEIIFDVDGPEVNAVTLAGLLSAAKLIINSNLEESLQGDESNA